MIRTAAGTLYTGITTDVQRRFNEHEQGGRLGAKYLRGKGPLQLVWQQSVPDRRVASRLELHIKRLSAQQKRAMIANGKMIVLDND
ncbi:GIY-YIG nuclease family protein [Maribrevibacterium harenarium]|uniref:GIY-YIG nuclease family protein n=2 Tax=Maribrevibacterium harenarium TaxID=2589817 RepID=A0A501X260_9GAMM|nr:GIY-YIG nuclease family protein [Maribrevibacterium harenarium]